VLHSAAEKGRAALCVSGAEWADSTVPRCSIRALARNAKARTNSGAAGLSRPQRVRRMLVDAWRRSRFSAGIGNERVALIGHSFGGAVAINAGR